MKKTIGAWTLAGLMALTVTALPAMAQGPGYGRGNGVCDGTQKRIHRQLRDGSGAGYGNRYGWQRGNGLRLRDGSGPNPNCPLKQK